MGQGQRVPGKGVMAEEGAEEQQSNGGGMDWVFGVTGGKGDMAREQGDWAGRQ